MRHDLHVVRRAVRTLVATALLTLAAVGALVTVEAGLGPPVLAVALLALVPAVATTMTNPGTRVARWVVARRVAAGVWLLLALVGSVNVSGPLGPVLVASGAFAWSALAPDGQRAARRILGLVSTGEQVWARLERQVRAGAGAAYIRFELRALDDPILREVWSVGRRPFPQRLPVRVVLGVATLRELVLDELEARDPTSFHAWMDSGAIAPAPQSQGHLP
jgi:hypothetical protein